MTERRGWAVADRQGSRGFSERTRSWVRIGCTWCSGPARSAVPSPRTWPGWVLRSGRCPGTGRPRWPGGIDWRVADVTDPEAADRRGQGRIGGLPVRQRPIHPVAGTLPAVAARRAGCCRAHRCAAGEPGEPVRLRPDRGQADDRGPPAGRHDRQGPHPGGHDRRAAGRRRGRPGPPGDRAGVGLLRPGRHRGVNAR